MNEFSSVSYMATQAKKYNDLNEYCSLILSTKIPKLYSKVRTMKRLIKLN